MRIVAAAVAAVALAALLPAAARAHPELVDTVPASKSTLAKAPARVVVRLSEPAHPVGDGLSVIGPDGREAARGPVVVSGKMMSRAIEARQQGSYLVEWLVVGDDTHPARGAFVFSVGKETRAAVPTGARGGIVLEAAGHWLWLLGFALGFGVPFAALLSGGMSNELWRPVSAGVVLMIVSEPVALLGQTAALAPSRMFDPGFAEDVFLTNYGHLAGLRLGAALGLWALAGGLRDASPRAQWSIPAAGCVVALVAAASSHRITGLPSAPSLVITASHIASFAAWLGCVIVALHASRGRLLARPAVLAALALALSGSGLAFAHLAGPSDLFETAYGATLGAKIALVAGTFALGATARRRFELAGALAVLAAASLLVSLVPPV
jgi:copper transport protein